MLTYNPIKSKQIPLKIKDYKTSYVPSRVVDPKLTLFKSFVSCWKSRVIRLRGVGYARHIGITPVGSVR